MPFTAKPMQWYVNDTDYTAYRTGESYSITQVRRWGELMRQQQVAYEHLSTAVYTAATTMYQYQQQWLAAGTAAANTTVYTTSGANWYAPGAAFGPASEEQQRRWRREKLMVLRASKRARKTLIRFLEPGQLASYAATGKFKVVASNGWVFELSKRSNALLLGDDGHADASFCIHPKQRFPDEDKILSLMLPLMTDVDDFLRIANRTNIRQRQLSPVPPNSPFVAAEPVTIGQVQAVVAA